MVLGIIRLCLILVGITIFVCKRIMETQNENDRKMSQYYHIMVEWVRKHQEGESVKEYFKQHNYKTVAIYGMKEMGALLLNELTKNDVDVMYVVDRDESLSVKEGIKLYSPDTELPEVDVMIITASFYFEEILKKMQQKGMHCDFVSLDDVICERYL